ncbi:MULTISPECIES: family 1 glycosylhydrolase [unclassified Rathayibacter]|uniref:glycoside hydrolase family 1 protein n=1 Tax=unclassified Rathayibacter TaxID=2609250 RepID=UPI001048EFD1|nr:MULTISPECIES: family 1 glycosylhydrolase [unclassified Rathayibacter]TCL79464.1 beta-glucosidase [Rathayibacter sp. PhB192]TCM25267.1 beta-glucosidase [Rathayibacter sp. PhB179]
MTRSAFPSDFFWGVATAGYQNEGGSTASDIWFLEHVQPTIFTQRSGAASDSWNRWEEDLDLAASFGLNSYRFSVEWARVEAVAGVFDQDALSHYEQIVDGCLLRGLAPIVTFSHFAAPHWFAAAGGWLAADAADRFAAYCDAVMRRFGDRISIAVTLNEPNLPQLLSWAELPPFVAELERATLHAASTASGSERYRVGNVVLAEEFEEMQAGLTRAHLAARAVIRGHRADLPVGISIAVSDDVAAEGGERVRNRKRSEVYEHWLDLASSDDFIGVQNYEREYYGPAGRLEPAEGLPLNAMGTAIEPGSLAGAVRYAHAVSGVPVLVTEHGLGASDDALRAGFIRPALDGLAQVLLDGVPVIGYCHWTLLDNYEWIFGYDRCFGLVEVDRETFARTPKASAAAYREYVVSAAAATAMRTTG